MKSQQWLAYFQLNKRERPEPKWNAPSTLPRTTQLTLARSLSHFQLGETGEGTFLLRGAQREAPADKAYHEALALFVAEENEHARLLERLVVRYGGRTIRQHWTHGLFRLVRHALGFKFEIQLLVTAELVGTAYYRLLRARTIDSVLDETCLLLLRDEARHLQFHAEWLGEYLGRLLPLERSAWAGQFQALFAAATRVAWVDHRSALSVSGSNREEFCREARRECISFLRQLDLNVAAAIPALRGALPAGAG